MNRKYRKLAILAKRETTYAADASPTGTADAMQMTEVTISPMEGTDVERDLMLPYLGHQGVELTGNYGRIRGSVQIAGSGAAGSVPAYGPLLRACGMSETVTRTTSVTYKPVSGSEESVSIYYNADGVNHILLGARGTLSMRFAPRSIAYFVFEMTGLLGTISDRALPTVSLSDFIKPIEVSKANTSMSLHGPQAPAESVSVDLGNQIEPRFLIGEETIELVSRKTTGAAVIAARTLAVKDWFAIARARTRGAVSIRHGKTAGNIVTVSGPAVEIGRPAQGETQGIVNYTLPLMFTPASGNDELSIVAT